MALKKFGNFNWIEMDSKDQNLDLIRTKRIYFCPFQSIFVYGVVNILCQQIGDRNQTESDDRLVAETGSVLSLNTSKIATK